MGLDVYAYKGLEKLTVACDEDGEPVDLERDYMRIYSSDGEFAERADGLQKGIYAYAGYRDGFSGGYGRYNRWRESLAKMAGYKTTAHTRWGTTEMLHAATCWEGETGPFSELINFTDCDGLIGSVTAAKLAKDFAEFDGKAKEFRGEDDFYEHYTEFRECMEFASDNGAVVFR